MNIFKIHQGYRDLGLGYGLPVYFVDFGVGLILNPEQTFQRLVTLGLQKGEWVVLRNGPIGEKGCGTLVSGLKKLGFRVEVEDEGAFGCPGWFPQADRWLIWYKETSTFNYHAMRPRQDMLIYKGEDILSFLADTKEVQALRAIMVKDRTTVWDLVRGRGEVRVYQNPSMGEEE